jgi:hypothetical protein
MGGAPPGVLTVLRRFLRNLRGRPHLRPSRKRWLARARQEAPGTEAGFDSVERYCLFIGTARSGHTLVGALLDAHPEMVISNEVHALLYVDAGLKRDELFWLLEHRAARDAERGRVNGDYKYLVPGQWQGRARTLRVIGDKRGGGTTRVLGERPGLLRRFQSTVEVPVRVVHVVRHPLDNVATIALRQWNMAAPPALAMWWAAWRYLQRARTNARLLEELGDAVLTVRHEDLIADPRTVLAALCQHFEVAAPEDYLMDCASIVWESPRRRRDTVTWPKGLAAWLSRRANRIPHLSSYGLLP